MAGLTNRADVAAALTLELERDPRVVFLAEEVAPAGGVFGAWRSR